MPSRGWTTVVAAAAYLAGTTIVTYAVLAGATWDDHPWVLPTLVLVHFAAGLAIGRWWALALPFAWALLSAGAEGYDTRASVVIAFFIPFTWLPATAAGVAVSRIVAWRRSGTGRLWPSILVLGTRIPSWNATRAATSVGSATSATAPAGSEPSRCGSAATRST